MRLRVWAYYGGSKRKKESVCVRKTDNISHRHRGDLLYTHQSFQWQSQTSCRDHSEERQPVKHKVWSINTKFNNKINYDSRQWQYITSCAHFIVMYCSKGQSCCSLNTADTRKHSMPEISEKSFRLTSDQYSMGKATTFYLSQSKPIPHSNLILKSSGDK